MSKADNPVLVGILMGSESDLDRMRGVWEVLGEFYIGYEVKILSAHRTPDLTIQYAIEAEKRGLRVLIAGAGLAAHLAGTVAAHTVLPVIGIPLATSSLGGLDSLLSTVQMPPGVPVAAVAINGSRNAGILAVEILAAHDTGLRDRLRQYRQRTVEKIQAVNDNLNLGPA
ncbi:MAG TPA: 5-(carboxyamino)imidazole ribonucleotide mutase [bacterium]|nr:5-(carboxyamino)imidazole ribonucleotide mutase [bacterium]HQL61953.1 5-(carboxyamino)imidazole ribonucleotide mutase [bacterium]